MKRCLLLLPIVLGLLFPLLLPTTVEACACCDGVIKRTPVAWSEAGDQVLVHLVDRSACGRRYAVEHWRARELGGRRPGTAEGGEDQSVSEFLASLEAAADPK